MTLDGVRLVVAGAGLRGLGYARRATETGRARVVAVAEPDPGRRERFAAEFGIAADRVYAGWSDLAAAGRIGDAVIVATQDRMHADPTVAFAQLGYHILLEKPMATTEEDAVRITQAVEEAGAIFGVCHVMRYTRYSAALKKLLDDGALGRLVSVQHLEPIGWWHFAHSFVRGNWSDSTTSGPLLLTKSCHDIDWLLYLFGTAPTRVSSFGGLSHFRPDQRPEGATDTCLTCPVEPTCPYSAPRLYLSCLGDADRELWPLSAVTADHTLEGVAAVLRTGPYGRCVYAGTNDVVDHQVVAMSFADGATCSFTLTAFTPLAERKTRLFGTHGSIDGDGTLLHVTDFRTGGTYTVDTGAPAGSTAADGHSGGDAAITDAFLAAVAAGDPSLLPSNARRSLLSHQVDEQRLDTVQIGRLDRERGLALVAQKLAVRAVAAPRRLQVQPRALHATVRHAVLAQRLPHRPHRLARHRERLGRHLLDPHHLEPDPHQVRHRLHTGRPVRRDTPRPLHHLHGADPTRNRPPTAAPPELPGRGREAAGRHQVVVDERGRDRRVSTVGFGNTGEERLDGRLGEVGGEAGGAGVCVHVVERER